MGWKRFFRRAKWDAERARELESYVQIETDKNRARGMSREDARAAASGKLGNATRVREEIYTMNTLAWLDAIGRNIRYALRGIRRSPAFTLIAVLTLALGIGATTVIYSVMDTVVLRRLPYPDAERLAYFDNGSHSYPQWRAWQESSASRPSAPPTGERSL